MLILCRVGNLPKARRSRVTHGTPSQYNSSVPSYRRYREGNLFFLTVVTHHRRPLFADDHARRLLRDAIEATRLALPWTTEAMVLLPDHLHMLWRLPDNDTDYSRRISAMKKRFTRAYLATGGAEGRISPSQRRQRSRGVWQKRFWEHQIRNARDYHMHVDYIHTNPVKHSHVDFPRDWPYSTFHRYVDAQWYERDWCGRSDLPGNVEYVWPEQ